MFRTIFHVGTTPHAPAREPRGGAPRPAGEPGRETLGTQSFTLSSESFSNGDVIPERLALVNGASPQLAWSNPPKGTERFVIIMDDPDAEPVVGHTFVHWVACVPARATSLPEGASSGGWTNKPKVLSGDNTSAPYRGPKPPAASGMHRYWITVFAVSESFADPDFEDLAHSDKADDTRTYTRERFKNLYRPDILALAEISGTYSVSSHLPH